MQVQYAHRELTFQITREIGTFHDPSRHGKEHGEDQGPRALLRIAHGVDILIRTGLSICKVPPKVFLQIRISPPCHGSVDGRAVQAEVVQIRNAETSARLLRIGIHAAGGSIAVEMTFCKMVGGEIGFLRDKRVG
jgi:hypothetical protein